MRWTRNEQRLIDSGLQLLYGDASKVYDNVMPDDAVIDFTARVSGPERKKMLMRRVAAYMSSEVDSPNMDNVGEFEITYNFSNELRNNIFPAFNTQGSAQYGSRMSYRMLYDYLCLEYNGGVYFIDKYFDLMQTRPWYDDFQKIKGTIREQMANEIKAKKEDLLGKRRAALRTRLGSYAKINTMADKDFELEIERINESFGEWTTYNVFRDKHYANVLSDLGKKIREDCILTLNTGMMPLARSQVVAPSTAKKREKFVDFNPDQAFFASGSLIRHLNIYIALDKEL